MSLNFAQPENRARNQQPTRNDPRHLRQARTQPKPTRRTNAPLRSTFTRRTPLRIHLAHPQTDQNRQGHAHRQLPAPRHRPKLFQTHAQETSNDDRPEGHIQPHTIQRGRVQEDKPEPGHMGSTKTTSLQPGAHRPLRHTSLQRSQLKTSNKQLILN